MEKHIPRPPNEEAAATIEEYQRRKKAFQPRWNRLMLTFALPAFALFVLGLFVAGPVGWGMVALGFTAFAASLGRGAMMMGKARTCPQCGKAQDSAVHHPYRTCAGCGVRLSHGARDST